MTGNERPVRRRRPAVLAMLLTVAAVAATVASAPPAGAAPPPLPNPNSNGITLTEWFQVNPWEGSGVPRLVDATMKSAAIFKPGTNPSINPATKAFRVRFLIPANYTTNPATPYPVLYLLHGATGSWEDWTSSGNIKEIVRATGFRGIVVMPEGGRSGWYTDWYGETDGRFRPLWETVHVDQLVRWVDANLNVIHDRSGRGIAGLSMGGLGALMYAGRNADVFGAVASFSGGTDLREPDAINIVQQSMAWGGAAFWGNGELDGNYRVSGSAAHRMQTLFGPTTGYPNINPYQMASKYNAYDMRFGLYAGQNSDPNQGERAHGIWADRFHAELKAKGVDHRYCTGPGTHEWRYWQEDLKDFIRYAFGTTPTSCPNSWGAPRS